MSEAATGDQARWHERIPRSEDPDTYVCCECLADWPCSTVLPDDAVVIVCAECERAACWLGEFMCEDSRTAGIDERTVAQLRVLALESLDWWPKSLVRR